MIFNDCTFELELECNHAACWKEHPADGGGIPYPGLTVYCEECGEDREIVNIEPQEIVMFTETLTENAPSITDAGASGWATTDGTNAVIVADATTGTYGYYFASRSGNFYAESDTESGFATPEEALEAAKARWFELEEEMRREEEISRILAEFRPQ